MTKERSNPPRPAYPEIEPEAPQEAGFECHTLKAGEPLEIPAGDAMDTLGLGPCAAVVMYDPVTKKALAEHVSPSSRPLIRFMELAREVFPDISRTRIYVVGANPEGDEDPSEALPPGSVTQEFRSNILQALAAVGVHEKQIKTKFNDDPRFGYDVMFDTRNGKMRITKYR